MMKLKIHNLKFYMCITQDFQGFFCRFPRLFTVCNLDFICTACLSLMYLICKSKLILISCLEKAAIKLNSTTYDKKQNRII